MRIVLDTNVAFSALLWRGTPYRLIEAVRRQQDQLITSTALLAELSDVLTRPFAVKRLNLFGRTAEELLSNYVGFVETVTPSKILAVVAADPDDDQVIAAAVTAEADIIVSGDRHLLSLGNYLAIRILAPAAALDAITTVGG